VANRQSSIGPGLRDQSSIGIVDSRFRGNDQARERSRSIGNLQTSSRVRERNIKLVVSYDGTDFHGWQRQPSQPTIQGCLEESLARIIGQRVRLYGSGRTDAGVHALGQVANFTTSCRIPCGNLVEALNHALPPTVRVRRADEVPLSFHARYDVRFKTYRYRILQAKVCAPFLWRFVWHCPYLLDRKSMAEGARVFLGEHDFTSFAASGLPGNDTSESACGPEGGESTALKAALSGHSRESGNPNETRASMVRTVYSSRILWRARTEVLTYEVRGSGFLHHMIRNMVGTLVEVGRGKLAPQDVVRILAARARTLAGPTAPAQGLCLVGVAYWMNDQNAE
jgi:tRNA pseudouridine38-40 synthase